MPSLTQERIFGLVGSIYEQAREPSKGGWQNIYLDIADVLSSGPGGFLLRNEECNRFNFAAGTIPPEFLREYIDHYQFVSPFRETYRGLGIGESIVRTREMSDSEYVRTEFYGDYLSKIDAFNFASHNLSRSGSITAGLVITRPKSRPDFTSTDERAMGILLPHLGRALEVYLNFVDIHNENRAMMTALSTMQQSVIVVDKYRKVSFASERAEVDLRAKDGLEIARDGTLRASSSNDDRRLSELLRGVFAPTIENIGGLGGAMQISRPDGSRPLHVRITPFSALTLLDDGTDSMAMIFVHDPDAEVETQESVLIQLYGLTKAEAHVAAVLASGKSTEEACEVLDITDNTARTHLKHIFSKTGTRRQSELVKLIINGPASLRLPN